MSLKYFFTLLFIASAINGYSQISLPKIGTTEKEALSDLFNNIANENWYSSKVDGKVIYSKLFKNTPVGIRHALDEYEDLIKIYKPNNCNDKSLYSSLVKNSRDEIDYEMLSITIKTEASEIDKTCIMKNDINFGFRLNSLRSGKNSFLMIVLKIDGKE